MNEHQTIAMLFSGGDSPGMNPLLRAGVRLAQNRHHATVLGIKDGYRGIVRSCRRLRSGERTIAELESEIIAHPGHEGLSRRSQDFVLLDCASVSSLSGRGGIVLGAARSPEFHDASIRKQAIELLSSLGIDVVIACGGNGTLAGAEKLAHESSLQVIGVPGTIDNDVAGTETTLGFDTAVNTAVSAVERFGDTAASHHRIMVLETMGRGSGALARSTALAGGVDIVVTPERGPLTAEKMQGIGRRLERSMTSGLDYAIVIVAEGVRSERDSEKGPTMQLAQFLQGHFQRAESLFPDVEVRASVLGHLQRGGGPSAADRLLAARFAEAACDRIALEPESSGVLGVCRGGIAFYPFGAGRNRVSSRESGELYQLQKSVSRWLPENRHSRGLPIAH